MNDAVDYGTMQAVYERLTRLEERGAARDERMHRMEQALERLTEQMEAVAADVRAAKTGLRVGLWIASTVLPSLSAGVTWLSMHLWGK
jgi:hypothetical protein